MDREPLESVTLLGDACHPMLVCGLVFFSDSVDAVLGSRTKLKVLQ